jgi:hypothetical protein
MAAVKVDARLREKRLHFLRIPVAGHGEDVGVVLLHGLDDARRIGHPPGVGQVAHQQHQIGGR